MYFSQAKESVNIEKIETLDLPGTRPNESSLDRNLKIRSSCAVISELNWQRCWLKLLGVRELEGHTHINIGRVWRLDHAENFDEKLFFSDLLATGKGRFFLLAPPEWQSLGEPASICYILIIFFPRLCRTYRLSIIYIYIVFDTWLSIILFMSFF